MRLCIPTVDSHGRTGTLSAHFGSAPYFTLVDSDAGTIYVLANPHARHQPGSCTTARGLRGHGVDAVVCHSLGRRALGSLQEAGIQVLVSDANDVASAVEAAQAGRLVPVTARGACGGGQHHHCG